VPRGPARGRREPRKNPLQQAREYLQSLMDRVTISTIHSAKGLDYACVFLVGLDELEPDGWSERQVRSLVYGGITRARHRLLVPYVTETEIISELRRCL